MDKKGGFLTGNQFYKFFLYFKKDNNKLLPKGFIPLNKKNKLLFNNKFIAFYNPNTLHFVIVHRGTIGNDVKDIFNNVRNFLSVKNKYLISKRNEQAKMGHNEVKNFLINLYKNKNKNKNKYLTYKSIIDYLDNLKKSSPIANISNSVDELLKRNLTTIGHSQGSIYAYLYGKDGKEIIVYNSPPFIGKKPENTYTIRHRYDPISYLNKSKKNVVLNHKTKTIIDSHKIKSLKNISKIFGDPFLYSLDYKSKTQKNRNKTEKNRNKTEKNRNKTQKNRNKTEKNRNK